MKTKLILAGLFAYATCVNSQNSNPWPTSGNVAVGGSGLFTPTNEVEIYSSSGGAQLGLGGTAPVMRFFGGGNCPAQWPSSFTNPYAKIGLATVTNHFIEGADAGDLCIQNMTQTNGIVFSSQVNTSINNGNEQMRLTTDGNLGIGTYPLGRSGLFDTRMHANYNFTPLLGLPLWAVKGVMTQTATQGAGAYENYTGVEGDATATSAFNAQGFMYGVQGNASYGLWNLGGAFTCSGGAAAGVGGFNYGVKAVATGNDNVYGIWGSASGGSTANWAGYFQGNTFCTGSYIGSDQKLKNDIKPMTNMLDKIMQLKPSTYTFKTSDFQKMNLPAGKQMGLIAQDLEQVFPELVKTVSEQTELDKDKNKVVLNPEFKAVQYDGLIPVLISGIQEQQSAISDQSKATQALTDQIAAQQKQIDELKALVNSLAGNPNSNKVGTATSIPVTMSDNDVIVLNQNVPNPFAESTVISYNIPTNFTTAQISFSTNDGKVVKVVNLTEKSGNLNVFANDLSSGVYNYTLIVDGKTLDTKKMVKN